ncbi:hypothetical protein [Sutterella wadsworthensis]|uniref:hypothetical protein n=1 Tax=Sutterella wadsworthensis TaxID=40545 RepID=UPI003AADE767
MNLSKKQIRDITRTALGFTGVLCAAAALIWLGNRNDAVTNAESLKAGILTAHQVKAAFETVGGRLVDRPIEEGMTVEAGAKLLAIDGTDIGLSIRQTEALIHQADAQIAAEEEGIRLALAEANTEEQTLWRQIEASEAARKSASAEWLRAEADWKRAQRLLPRGAMAQSDFDAPRPLRGKASPRQSVPWMPPASGLARKTVKSSRARDPPKACGSMLWSTPVRRRKTGASAWSRSKPGVRLPLLPWSSSKSTRAA